MTDNINQVFNATGISKQDFQKWKDRKDIPEYFIYDEINCIHTVTNDGVYERYTKEWYQTYHPKFMAEASSKLYAKIELEKLLKEKEVNNDLLPDNAVNK